MKDYSEMFERAYQEQIAEIDELMAEIKKNDIKLIEAVEAYSEQLKEAYMINLKEYKELIEKKHKKQKED